MICTFGDITDVTWWRELSLPVRAVIQPNGTLRAGDVGRARLGVRRSPRRRSRPTTELANLSVGEGPRAKSSSSFAPRGDLVGDPRPITHPVKFYEKGDRPLEIITSRQWFIKTMDFRERVARAGPGAAMAPRVHARTLRKLGERPERRLVRQPPAILRRAVPCLVSDQSVTASSTTTARLVPDESRLPIDPSTDVPEGYTADQRGKPGGFAGDPDIMDTWATSSLTPQIAGGWLEDPDLFARVFPMDLRPQAHDIIRTWLFSTVLRSHLGARSLPWYERRDFRMGPRSRSQEDVEVEGQCRHADGPARGARIRRRALLGGERPARHRHGIRPGPDAGRPASRHQAPECARFALSQADPRGPVTEPLDRAC